ncbi:hypothetical protein [Sphingomonas sp. S2M10]|uniref:hypothetical protein n=1 Tax=Sphingomonas sp. S2M10 TaxID=2705010 RepID=UPI0014578799|nr:hypothetical protein [Sphingomonas sp. S2M10]
MSFSREHRNLRADSGSGFPIDPSADTLASFAGVIADALRADFGTSPAKVKHIARLTGSNPRTVQNWLYARNGPSGAGLVVLMRHSDAVTAAVLALADRSELQRGAVLQRASEELRAAIAYFLDCLGQE